VTATIGPTENPAFDPAAWHEKLAALGAENFVPDGIPKDRPVQTEEFDIDVIGRPISVHIP
jgi:hypothetical protein